MKLGWLAPSGRFDWSDIILPSVTLGAALSAILTRMVRSSVIEELGEDYVRTARAKGLSETKVVYKHVLKNGLIPVVTILGFATRRVARRRNHHRKDFWLAGSGTAASRRWYRQAGLPRCAGLCFSDQHDLYRGQYPDGHVYRWLDPRIRVS